MNRAIVADGAADSYLRAYEATGGSADVTGTLRLSRRPLATASTTQLEAASSPVPNGCEQVFLGNRDTFAGPEYLTASKRASNVTESSSVPIWLVVRPLQTL